MNSPTNTKRIVAEYVEYNVAIAEFIFGITIPRPVIGYWCRGTTIGQSRYTTRSIDFNLRYAREHIDVLVTDTIPHEVAHYVTDQLFPDVKEAHSPEWYNIARALGMHDPQPKTRPMILSTHFVVQCTVCGEEQGLTRRQYRNLRFGHYYHVPCGPDSTFQYVGHPTTDRET